MNKSQIKTLQQLTRNIDLYYGGADEFFSFKVSPMNHGAVMLTASNIGSPWFCSHKLAVLIIGPRGGVDRKNKTLDNMRESLVF